MIGARPAPALAPPRWPGESAEESGTHQLLRQVALQLFATQGFHPVSLRQLAAALHMQVGSLYNHIESKQVLLFELIEAHEHELLECLRKDPPRQASGRLQLESYVRLHLRFNALHEQRHALACLEFRSLSPEQRNRITALRERHTRHLENLLAQCALPPSECPPIALAIQAMLNGVAPACPDGGRPLAALLSRTLLNGLRTTQA
jgi:AcrR family transcriptional regulator